MDSKVVSGTILTPFLNPVGYICIAISKENSIKLRLLFDRQFEVVLSWFGHQCGEVLGWFFVETNIHNLEIIPDFLVKRKLMEF